MIFFSLSVQESPPFPLPLVKELLLCARWTKTSKKWLMLLRYVLYSWLLF